MINEDDLEKVRERSKIRAEEIFRPAPPEIEEELKRERTLGTPRNIETPQIWIIDHKATLNEFSPMNLDGSSWILGVCVLSAADKGNALEKFHDFLKAEIMELIEIYDVRKYSINKFKDNSRRSAQINNAARMIREDGRPCYVYARTSESME